VGHSPGKDHLDLRGVMLLTTPCILWGFNAIAIKVSNNGIAPIVCAGLRSLIAVLVLIFWTNL
jgi:drug/metabolite transporter (DMT)-like permease